MTNEQTLEYLRIMAILNGNETPLEGIEQIKKDLKILDIIKEHKLLNYVIKNEKCAKMYNLTEEDINKLKEWMENE